jgi:hypothetical protein
MAGAAAEVFPPPLLPSDEESSPPLPAPLLLHAATPASIATATRAAAPERPSLRLPDRALRMFNILFRGPLGLC